jgi:hypothetical protein
MVKDTNEGTRGQYGLPNKHHMNSATINELAKDRIVLYCH